MNMSNIKNIISNNYNINSGIGQNPQSKNTNDSRANQNEDTKLSDVYNDDYLLMTNGKLLEANELNKKLFYNGINITSGNNYNEDNRKEKFCNIVSCTSCHGDRALAIREELKKQPRKPKDNKKLTKWKTCKHSCKFCSKVISRIEDRLFEIALSDSVTTKKDQGKLDNDGDDQKKTNITMETNESNKLESRIKTSKIDDYVLMEMPKDGNCLFTSLLSSQRLYWGNHQALRDQINSWTQEESHPQEYFSESGNVTEKEYLDKMGKPGNFGTNIELYSFANKLQAWIAIYMADDRYAHNPWLIIKGQETKNPTTVLYIKLKQGGISGSSGHYDSLIPKQDSDTRGIPHTLNFQMDIDPTTPSRDPTNITTTCNILILNANSINSWTKRIFLTDCLMQHNIHIACIQETFLQNTSKWRINGFRIYRADNQTSKRKGVAVLISNKIAANSRKVLYDAQGRYVKVMLEDPYTKKKATISSLYLEPTNEDNLQLIVDDAWNSDIIGADLNKAPSNLNKKGVYHMKNVSVKKELSLPKGISDHSAIIGECKIPFHLVSGEEEAFIICKKTAVKNEGIIRNAFLGEIVDAEGIADPRKLIKINRTDMKLTSNQLAEEWTSAIEKEKEQNKEKLADRYRELAKLAEIGQLDKMGWTRLNNLLNLKRKSEIYNPGLEKQDIINGFKQLYEDKGEKGQKLSSFAHLVQNTIQELSELGGNDLSNLPSTEIPYSKARDLYGFSQRNIIRMIKGKNLKEDIENYQKLLNKVWDLKGRSFFIHRTSRVMLFKKVEEITDYKDTRPISILPASIITLEKLASPTIKKLVKGKISFYQYGFKQGSDINMAKLHLSLDMQLNKRTKALLIDLRKAYDTVDLDKLTDTIKQDYPQNEAELLLSFVNLYKTLNMEIAGGTVNPTRGLPQGSALAPMFFNIYLDPLLRKSNVKGNWKLQAYADDMVINSDNIVDIQIAFDEIQKAITELRMSINIDKCELISNDLNDTIIDDSTRKVIEAKDSGKYLGQHIDAEGRAVADITKQDLGKLINIFTTTSSLSRKARIKLFKIYSRSRIGHLIPLLALTKNVLKSWKEIRSVIFRSVLKRSTMPRETASVLKIGFFDILIQPVLTAYEKYGSKDIIIKGKLKEALLQLMKDWVIAEPNWPVTISKMITDTIEEKNWFTKAEWRAAIDKDAHQRLFRNSEVNYKETMKITQPDVLLYLSNAPEHEIEQRTKTYHKSGDVNQKEAEEKAIKEILVKYLLALSLKENPVVLNSFVPDDTDTIGLIEYYSIREAKIIQLKEEVLRSIHLTAQNLCDDIIFKNINISENTSPYIKTEGFVQLKAEYIMSVLKMSKEEREDVETMLSTPIDLEEGLTRNYIKKKGPGRPKLEKKTDARQTSILDFIGIN